MFQLNMNNNRQHQTLALNSLVMNNVFNLANCFNQFGAFNLRSGFRHHPFFVCVLLLAVFLQVSLTELNAFGLENLHPIQWFVCFVFAILSALIAPLTGQQQRNRMNQQQQQVAASQKPNMGEYGLASHRSPAKHHQHQHHQTKVVHKPHRSPRTPSKANRQVRPVSQLARRSQQTSVLDD